jgi:hypothetical protein
LEYLDEEDAIRWVCGNVSFEWIGDLCMGRGSVGYYAWKAGKKFVGTELNHKRLSVLVERIKNAGAKWEGKWVKIGHIDGTLFLVAENQDNCLVGAEEYVPCDDTRIEPLCENEYGIIELNGVEYMCLSDNDDFDSYLGDKEGNVYKASYDDYGKLVSAELVASLDSEIGEGTLLGLEALELPREFLEGLPIEYVGFLGVIWGDCYPVCYDSDYVVEDIYDADGCLLWNPGDNTDNLVIDETYEFVRPMTKAEKEEVKESNE